MRINIDIDDKLMADVMATGDFKTKRAAVEAGLRLVHRRQVYGGLLALRGQLDWDDSDTAYVAAQAEEVASATSQELKATQAVSTKQPATGAWHTHFTRQARYHLWATHRLLDAVSGLPDDAYRRDVGLFFKSIHGTLNHLLVGEVLLWFARFSEGASPRLALDVEVESDRVRLGQALKDGAAQWEHLIAGWPTERFDGQLDYTTMKGVAQSLPFAACLAHVFNHATHHRGQITAALTAFGQPGPELDWVYHLQLEAAEAKK